MLSACVWRWPQWLLYSWLDVFEHFKEKWVPRPLSEITKLLTVRNSPHHIFFSRSPNQDVFICLYGSLAGSGREAGEVSVSTINPSTVPLLLKTIHIPHARTPVVSLYAVAVFTHFNEQYLNTEARLNQPNSKPQDWQDQGGALLYVHVCVSADLATNLEPQLHTHRVQHLPPVSL